MTDLPASFALSDGERRHPLWTKLKAHLESRLHDLHGKLEGDQTEQQTAILRGHIRCLRELIRLGDEPPQTDG